MNMDARAEHAQLTNRTAHSAERTNTMTSYQILKAAEKLGAHTVEIRESGILLEQRLTGVANSTPQGTVQCYIGDDIRGEHDCEVSPEEFSKRFEITAAIFR